MPVVGLAEDIPATTEPIAETAGAHLATAVPVAVAEMLVADAIAMLSSGEFAECDPLWIVDDDGRLRGVVSLTSLLAEARDGPLQRLIHETPRTVSLDVDQERVATVAHEDRLKSVPVVDQEGRFVGVVPPLALIDVLRREHDEDLRRLVGILGPVHDARAALEIPPWQRVANRLPWLLVGLCGAVLAAIVVASFEQALQAQLAIAFFIPAIVYLADAIGTQTEAVAVRGLSLNRAPLRRLLIDEIVTGALLGLILGLLVLPVVVLLFGNVALALAVAIAIVVSGMVATGIGLLLPWLLSRASRDPAYGSGPVATVVQDVLSLLVYFATAALLL